MKGFPNQISDISKLTVALYALQEKLEAGDSIDDDSYGEALLRHGVTNPGRRGEDVDEYLTRMRTKNPSNQSHRTIARMLKEFFRLSDLVTSSGDAIDLTDTGESLLEAWSVGDELVLLDNWRTIARGTTAWDEAGTISHPYRIMLRLLAERPGTPRALCPLALEARDDSEEEFQRILALRDLGDEASITQQIGISRSNWDNAKKILPSIAEQLGDVARNNTGLFVVNAGGGTEEASPAVVTRPARKVTPTTIASSKEPEDSDEGPDLGVASQGDLVSLAEAIAKRSNRNYRHNQLVQQFSQSLTVLEGLWEGDFDCLAVTGSAVVLAEMKTLDGTMSDEVSQLRGAVSQLLYYQAFSIPDSVKDIALSRPMIKVAVFESSPSGAHIQWLESLGIYVLWLQGAGFATTATSQAFLSDHLQLNLG